MINDIKRVLKMMRARVRDDEDGRLLTFWEKAWVGVLVILGIIVFEDR